MPTFRQSIALGIGANNNNIMAGSIYEFVGRPTRVIVAASTDDADIGIGVNFGSRTMAQSADTLVPVEPGAGQGPRIPEDVIVDDIADAGERLQVSLAGGAGASVTRVLVQLTEL